MTPGVAVVLCLIILVLLGIILRVQRAVVVMTRNQQRLYVCFRELLKITCPDSEKSILLNIERLAKDEEVGV